MVVRTTIKSQKQEYGHFIEMVILNLGTTPMIADDGKNTCNWLAVYAVFKLTACTLAVMCVAPCLRFRVVAAVAAVTAITAKKEKSKNLPVAFFQGKFRGAFSILGGSVQIVVLIAGLDCNISQISQDHCLTFNPGVLHVGHDGSVLVEICTPG